MRRQQTLQYLLTRVMKMRRIVLSVEKECYEHRSMKFTSVYNYRKKNHQSHVFYVKLILFTIVSHYRYIICFHITKRTIRKINKSNKSTRINAKREWKKKSKMKVKVFEWWTAVLNNPLWLHLTPLQDLKWKVCCYFQDKRQKNRKIANRTGSYKSSEIIMETIRHGFSFYFASATSSYVIKTKRLKN